MPSTKEDRCAIRAAINADEVARVDISAAHGFKVCTALVQQFFGQGFCIGDDTNRTDCIKPQLRANHNWLRVCIADTADADIAPHFLYVLFKFRPERGIFNAVDISLESEILGIGGHSASSCAEVGMIVCSEENVRNAVDLRGCTEKTAHSIILP